MSHRVILGGVLFLTVRTEIGRAIAFHGAFDRMRVAFARFAFALVDAKNAFDSLKPPVGVGEIGSGIETELQRAAKHRDDRFVEGARLRSASASSRAEKD